MPSSQYTAYVKNCHSMMNLNLHFSLLCKLCATYTKPRDTGKCLESYEIYPVTIMNNLSTHNILVPYLPRFSTVESSLIFISPEYFFGGIILHGNVFRDITFLSVAQFCIAIFRQLQHKGQL